MAKEATITGDTTDYNTYYTPGDRVTTLLRQNNVEYLTNAQNKLEKFFNKKVHIDIIDGNMTTTCGGVGNETAGSMSMGCQIDKYSGFIVMDTSFWNGHYVLHEITHMYNRTLPDETDSSYSFFNESLTEYLSMRQSKN
jgi:hypothetical protein